MAFIVTAITGASIATVAAVGGVALGAYGAYSSSKNNKKQSQAQASQANMNADIAKRNAADVVKQGKDAIFDQKLATLRSLGQVRSGTAGAGFVVDSKGTTGELLFRSMAEAGELDISRLKENIDREKQRALDQGANFTAQANQFKIQSRGYNPLLSGFTAGLGGVNQNADILFPAKVT
tara:strand:+ start:392 stop:928 length:537 start_codon:yes stop_codon:yes gene_type:complete